MAFSLAHPGTAAKIALSAVIVVVGVEATTRGWLWLQDQPYSAARNAEMMQGFVASMRGFEENLDEEKQHGSPGYLLHPYLGFAFEKLDKRLESDLEGFRSGSAAQTYDILILGSSVAAGFGNKGGAKEVAAILAADPRFAGEKLRFLKYGRGAYKQPQQLILFVYLLSEGFEPDAVLCIDGFNEMLLAIGNQDRGVHPSFPGAGQWLPLTGKIPTDRESLELLAEVVLQRARAEDIAAQANRFALSWSAVLGTLARTRLADAQSRWSQARAALLERIADHALGKGFAGGAYTGDRQDAMRRTASLWARATGEMAAICEGRDIPFLAIIQPNPLVPGSKPLTPEESQATAAYTEWSNAAVEGYPRIQAEAEELVDTGVSVLDATLVFAETEERVWVDAGHLNKRGNQILAAFVAEKFLSLIAPR